MSTVGIAVITAALVILLSAFNGIESMVQQLYSDFDADIVVRSTKGKTFLEDKLDTKKLEKFSGVESVVKVVEETVILKNGKKWVNAQLLGVENQYIVDVQLEKHLVDGYAYFDENGKPTAVVGATLMDKIEASVDGLTGFQQLTLYTPLRDASISRRKSPFKVNDIHVVGRMNYNREVNSTQILTSLEYAREQLDYTTDLTAVFISIKKDQNAQEIKELLQAQLGTDFKVKTAAEKNELIFKTSQSEKRIVFVILIFIFILAAFNLIASLTMLFIEKKENIQTMTNIGASQKFIFNIFFYEGILISFLGVFIGLIIGVLICVLQMKFAFLQMPNSNGEAFPILLQFKDILLIVVLVGFISFLGSFLPVRYLVKRHFSESK
ncbi:MAG: ABC transporter permease [Fluviicola sp.]